MKSILKYTIIRALLSLITLILLIAFGYFYLTYNKISIQTENPANPDGFVKIDVEPVFAHIIVRHGERNIEKSYPNNPYTNESYWLPGGYGALTTNGKREVYKTGEYLRRRYKKMLGEYYTPNKVYIHSSDYDRTLMSAQLLLAALFPPVGDEIWNDGLNWQPIPVHSRPITQELLLPHNIPCPRFNFLYAKYMKSPEYKLLLQPHSALIAHWEKMSGKKLELSDIFFLYDTLYVEHRRGFDLPEWAIEAIQANGTMERLAASFLIAFTHSTELKKLQAGFLIKEILDRFQNKSLDRLQPNRSIWISSGHDLTFTNILNALNLFDLHLPPYAASLHFELYKSNNDYYVQLFYRKENEEILSPLDIPNCGTKCPLKKYYELYDDILPTEDYNTACLNSDR